MKNLSRKTVLLAIAVLIIFAGIFLYFAAPSYLYNKFIDGQRREAGLTIKSVNIPDFKIVYAEGGTGDVIILVHGFTGNKDNWPSFAKFFTPSYRVIIPDLPGFGDSSKPQDKNYSIMSQVERLNLFARELKLTKFHLAGNSMGGSIAGNYAAAYPEMVKTLGLFNSAGVVSPTKSERALLLEKGINPFVIKDVNDFDRLLEFAFVKTPQIPSLMKKYLAKQAIKASPFNSKIGKDASADSLILEGKLDKITAPVLIVWGDSDKLIHVSAAEVFQKGITNSRSVIIQDCGHMPMLEKPAETAKIYRDFLEGKNK